MLYKKYHRNFIRQFKKGTKVKYRYDNGTETIIGKVITEPYYVGGTIRIIVSKSKSRTLVMPSGQLIDNINVI